MSVLVLRGSVGGQIHGMGVADAYGLPFGFPGVGEPFEAPGPELVAIEDPYGVNEPDDQHRYGIHGYAWGVTNDEPGAWGCFGRWYIESVGTPGWLVLDAPAEAVVYDKRRTSGRCRVKRGTVAYMGALRGALDYMRQRWPEDAGPVPDWEGDPIIYPPAPPRAKPITWTHNHYGWLVPAP